MAIRPGEILRLARGAAGRWFAALLMALLLMPGPAVAAATCANPQALRGSAVAEQFWLWVAREYGLEAFDTRTGPLAIGHALGRVASAVQSDPDREATFACLELAIEQQIIGETWALDLLWPRARGQDEASGPEMFRTIMRAAMGMHDNEVFLATGVLDASPAYAYFAALPRGTLIRPSTPPPPPMPGPPSILGQPVGDAPEEEPEAAAAPEAVAATEAHPWEGLCLPQLHEAGYRPIFGLWNNLGVRGPVVYADPVSNDYVSYSSADPCTRSDWDWAEFYSAYGWVSDRYLGHDEDQVFWKIATWKEKDRSNYMEIRYYR